MLLRVEKVSGGNCDPTLSPNALHTCLATSKHSSRSSSSAVKGEILSIGRKNCSVTLDDKCVSRGHAVIRLIRSNDNGDNGDNDDHDDDDDNEDKGRMEFGRPSTAKEVEACEVSSSGVAAIVQDLGSKFGTFVSVNEAWAEACRRKGEVGDGEETGDETDDGGQDKATPYVELSEKQKRAVALLSGNSSSDGNQVCKGLKFLKLEPRQAFPLRELSRPSGGGNASALPVIVLFGPQGSGIRLSPTPLQFTFSRLDAKTQKRLSESLPYIGAMHSPQWDVLHSTHLITQEKLATAKHIMAWACRRPVVTTHYVDALLQRSAPEDPLPQEPMFAPPGETQLDRLSDDLRPGEALKGYRIGVLLDDDSKPLAQSAGAHVFNVHGAPIPTFAHWWDHQAKLAEQSATALLVVDTSSKKAKRWKHALQLLETQGVVVRYTSPKNLAKAITNGTGEGLLDTSGELIQRPQVLSQQTQSQESSQKQSLQKPLQESLHKQSVQKPLQESLQKQSRQVSRELRNLNEHQSNNENNDQREINPTQTNKEKNDAEHEMEETIAYSNNQDAPYEKYAEHAEEVINHTNKASDSTHQIHTNMDESKQQQQNKKDHPSTNITNDSYSSRQKRHREPEDPREHDQDREDRPSKRIHTSQNQQLQSTSPSQQAESTLPSQQIESKSPSQKEESTSPVQRMPLPMTKDGWFLAAPSHRKAYRNMEPIPDYPPHSAETAMVSNLIVRPYHPKKSLAPNIQQQQQQRRRQRQNKPNDFKRFRKNVVMRGYSSFSNSCGGSGGDANPSVLPSIQLVAVLPKESERQRQLEFQQQELEREQEFADALFNEGVVNKGLRGYFTPSKRGRGRR